MDIMEGAKETDVTIFVGRSTDWSIVIFVVVSFVGVGLVLFVKCAFTCTYRKAKSLPHVGTSCKEQRMMEPFDYVVNTSMTPRASSGGIRGNPKETKIVMAVDETPADIDTQETSLTTTQTRCMIKRDNTDCTWDCVDIDVTQQARPFVFPEAMGGQELHSDGESDSEMPNSPESTSTDAQGENLAVDFRRKERESEACHPSDDVGNDKTNLLSQLEKAMMTPRGPLKEQRDADGESRVETGGPQSNGYLPLSSPIENTELPAHSAELEALLPDLPSTDCDMQEYVCGDGNFIAEKNFPQRALTSQQGTDETTRTATPQLDGETESYHSAFEYKELIPNLPNTDFESLEMQDYMFDEDDDSCVDEYFPLQGIPFQQHSEEPKLQLEGESKSHPPVSELKESFLPNFLHMYVNADHHGLNIQDSMCHDGRASAEEDFPQQAKARDPASLASYDLDCEEMREAASSMTYVYMYCDSGAASSMTYSDSGYQKSSSEEELTQIKFLEEDDSIKTVVEVPNRTSAAESDKGELQMDTVFEN